MKRLPVPGPRALAALYAAFATLALLLLIPNMPPFQNADELAHFLRADTLAHGQILPHRLGTRVGGEVDSGIDIARLPFEPLRASPSARATRALYATIPWGPARWQAFPNTAIYPPAFYAPGAFAIRLAHAAGLPVLRGLQAARLATGLTTIALATLAIALAGAAAPWLFAILLLPMSLALTAAMSQDGPMLGATALAAARSLRAPTPRTFAALCVLLALIGMARPPYAAFALLLLALPVPPRWRWTGFAATLLAILAWSLATARFVTLPTIFGPVAPSTQLAHLLQHPLRLPALLANTWHLYHWPLLQGFIGQPGWQDVPLPLSYHLAAVAILALTALAMALAGTGPRNARLALAAATAILASAAGIAAIQYLTWTPIDAGAIAGMQGRYFLPPALLLAGVLARPAPNFTRVSFLVWIVMLFPIVSIAVLMRAVVVRYYFGA